MFGCLVIDLLVGAQCEIFDFQCLWIDENLYFSIAKMHAQGILLPAQVFFLCAMFT